MPETGPNTTYLVGLTGGIGSGKSTVSALFAELGAGIIDADEISRALLQPGTAQFAAVSEHFGSAILDDRGNVDRARLRTIIFSDAGEKQWLETLLHPAIRAEIQGRIQTSDKPYVVLVVPLLVESGNYGFVDRILVVDVPEAVQVDRIIARDGTTPEAARRIVSAQATREQRLAAADDIIRNDSTREALGEQVRLLHARYLQAATG